MGVGERLMGPSAVHGQVQRAGPTSRSNEQVQRAGATSRSNGPLAAYRGQRPRSVNESNRLHQGVAQASQRGRLPAAHTQIARRPEWARQGRSASVGFVIAMIATSRHGASASRPKAAPRNDGTLQTFLRWIGSIQPTKKSFLCLWGLAKIAPSFVHHPQERFP